jgi:protein tyrosine kinase modulator
MARVTKGFSSSTSAGRGREAELRVAIEAQRKKLLELKNLRDQLAVLQRDVDGAQSAYEGVGKRYNQSNLEAQLTQTNVHVLSVAEAPLKPSFPVPLKFSAVTVLIGLALGCGLAFLLELLNRRVRSIEDVTTMLELPVLVTIEQLPRSKKPGRLLWWRRTALTSR